MALLGSLEDKIRKELSRLRIKCRGIEVDEDRERVIIKAEVSRNTDQSQFFEKSMKKLRLRKVSGSYGRWEFRFSP